MKRLLDPRQLHSDDFNAYKLQNIRRGARMLLVEDYAGGWCPNVMGPRNKYELYRHGGLA